MTLESYYFLAQLAILYLYSVYYTNYLDKVPKLPRRILQKNNTPYSGFVFTCYRFTNSCSIEKAKQKLMNAPINALINATLKLWLSCVLTRFMVRNYNKNHKIFFWNGERSWLDTPPCHSHGLPSVSGNCLSAQPFRCASQTMHGASSTHQVPTLFTELMTFKVIQLHERWQNVKRQQELAPFCILNNYWTQVSYTLLDLPFSHGTFQGSKSRFLGSNYSNYSNSNKEPKAKIISNLIVIMTQILNSFFLSTDCHPSKPVCVTCQTTRLLNHLNGKWQNFYCAFIWSALQCFWCSLSRSHMHDHTRATSYPEGCWHNHWSIWVQCNFSRTLRHVGWRI